MGGGSRRRRRGDSAGAGRGAAAAADARTGPRDRRRRLAEETSLRINDFGMLGVQHMIAADAGEAENVYLEFICCAEEPDAAAGDASASPEARRAPPTSPEASPAF